METLADGLIVFEVTIIGVETGFTMRPFSILTLERSDSDSDFKNRHPTQHIYSYDQTRVLDDDLLSALISRLIWILRAIGIGPVHIRFVCSGRVLTKTPTLGAGARQSSSPPPHKNFTPIIQATGGQILVIPHRNRLGLRLGWVSELM